MMEALANLILRAIETVVNFILESIMILFVALLKFFLGVMGTLAGKFTVVLVEFLVDVANLDTILSHMNFSATVFSYSAYFIPYQFMGVCVGAYIAVSLGISTVRFVRSLIPTMSQG